MKKRSLSMMLRIVMVFTMLSGMSLTAYAADVTATLDSNGVQLSAEAAVLKTTAMRETLQSKK